ncbi:MAG: hypothetical protein AAFN59_03540 [Pseudomonadota bacterium]
MRRPWHLWLVGIVSLIWNGLQAADYTMAKLQLPAYTAQMSTDQLAFFQGFPLWASATWAIAVWAALLGSILLLAREGAAAIVFAIALIAMLATGAYTLVLAQPNMLAMAGTGPALLSGLIILVGIGFWIYARAMRQRGILE